MESTGEIVKQLNQPSTKNQSAIDKFVNTCGKFSLLSPKGIEHMKNLQGELETLYNNTQPSVGTHRSYEALEAAIAILKKMTEEVKDSNPNNNYNFFTNSPEAKGFYDIAFPKGSSTPEINDDLAAAVGQKLLVALENFSPWKHLNTAIFLAYKVIPGNPIQAAKKDLQERIDHYHQIDKDRVILIAFSNISNKLSQLSRAPSNSDPKELKAKYDEIAVRLNEANFQFTHEQTSGIQAVASGVLLPQIIACQESLVSKFGIPIQALESIPVTLPKPSDPGQFEKHLLDYCQRLENNIDRYFERKKDVKKDKASLFKYLKMDIQTHLNEIKSGKTTLADGCLMVYNAVADAVSKHHQIAAGKSTSIDLLNSALAEIKEIAGHYNISMSVRGLTLPQQPSPRQEIAPKAETVAPHK